LRKVPQLDKVAIWQPINTDALDVRKYDSYSYIHKGLLHESKEPVYRYAKNFSLDDFAYSLLLVTHEQDQEQVSKIFESVSVTLTPADQKHIKDGASIIKYAEAQ
jgi:hypothetical protein